MAITFATVAIFDGESWVFVGGSQREDRASVCSECGAALHEEHSG